MTTIGDRVRELRTSKGLSQQALTGDGISAGYVSLIESGKRTPSAEVAAKLAQRLGVEVSELARRGAVAAATSDQARLEVNFARLALANGNPAEAVRCLTAVSLDELDSETAVRRRAGAGREPAADRASSTTPSGCSRRSSQRCRREQAWMTLAVAATVLAVMHIESGDVARSVEIAERALHEVEDAGLRGTDEHLRLGSILVSALLRARRPAGRDPPHRGADPRRRPDEQPPRPRRGLLDRRHGRRTSAAGSPTPSGSPTARSRCSASRRTEPRPAAPAA